MKRSAKPPLVIHIFSPERMKLPSGCRIGARLGAERVGAGAGLAEAVGADHLAGDEPRQILLLLLFGAEHEDREDRRGWPARQTSRRTTRSATAARRRRASRSCRGRRRRTPPAGSVPSSPERAALRDQLAIERPVLLLEPFAFGSTSWSMNSAAVCPISRCSSVSFSGVITVAGSVSSINHAPPLVICCSIVSCHVSEPASRSDDW